VLIVSHNIPLVINLCHSALLFDRGALRAQGETGPVVDQYLEGMRTAGGEASWPDSERAPGDGRVRLQRVCILQEGRPGPSAEVDIARPVQVEIRYRVLEGGEAYYTGLWLRDRTGVAVLASTSSPSMSLVDDGWTGRPRPAGLYRSVCTLPANFLNEGRYSVTAIVGTRRRRPSPWARRRLLRRPRHRPDARRVLRPVDRGGAAAPRLEHRAGRPGSRNLARPGRRVSGAGPIRVCFVNFYAYPLFNPAAEPSFGGAEVQLYVMATELAKDADFAVSFLVRDPAVQPGEVREGVAIHGHVPHGRGPRFTGRVRQLRALWSPLRSIGPDIVIQRAAGR
jgi:hypothetical protein